MTAGRLVIWRGVNGSIWVLHGDGMGEQGVYLTSFAGLYHPVRVPIDIRPAYMQGARPGIPKTDPRIVDMKIFTSAQSSQEWEDIENAWWDSWSDEADGTLEVYSADGASKREIDLRLQKYPDEPFDFEPDDVMDWTMPTIAYRPWWRGTMRTSQWENTDGTGSGTVTLANPGDVEVWPQYMLENLGEGETYTLPDGLSGATVPIELDVADGDVLVDTDQMRLQLESATDTQIAARMAAMKFHTPIAPRTKAATAPVSVTDGTTAAKVKAYMQPLYQRPW